MQPSLFGNVILLIGMSSEPAPGAPLILLIASTNFEPIMSEGSDCLSV